MSKRGGKKQLSVLSNIKATAIKGAVCDFSKLLLNT